MKENSIEKTLENIQNVDLITLLRKFKKEGVENFITIRRNDFDEILSDYKRVLKENERYQESDYETICLENNELSEFVDRIQSEYNDLINELLKLPECKLYGLKKCKKNALLIIKDEFIPVQKVKAKIEELKQENKKKYGNCLIEMYEDELVNRDIKILQELLESEE